MLVVRPIRQKLVTGLDRIGLGGVARRAWHPLSRRIGSWCRAHGLAAWQPLVPVEAFSSSLRRAIEALRRADPSQEFGDYLEFGVSRGTSLAAACHVLAEEGLERLRLIGFDSFEGLPAEEPHLWKPGFYRSTLWATRRYIRSQGVDLARIVLVKGWFRDSLTAARRSSLGLAKASIIMIDCDLYSASRDALGFCAPLIRGPVILIFDDWGCMLGRGRGQKEVFEEFLADHPHLQAEELTAYHRDARLFLVTERETRG